MSAPRKMITGRTLSAKTKPLSSLTSPPKTNMTPSLVKLMSFWIRSETHFNAA